MANGPLAGWGAVALTRKRDSDNSSGTVVASMYGPVDVDRNSKYWLGADRQSNNTGELSAIGEVLLWFRDFISPATEFITIYTDSQLCIDFLEGRSKPKANLGASLEALAATVKGVYDSLVGQVELVKVPGHSKDRWNDHADTLAKRGASGDFTRVGRHGANAVADPQRKVRTATSSLLTVAPRPPLPAAAPSVAPSAVDIAAFLRELDWDSLSTTSANKNIKIDVAGKGAGAYTNLAYLVKSVLSRAESQEDAGALLCACLPKSGSNISIFKLL